MAQVLSLEELVLLEVLRKLRVREPLVLPFQPSLRELLTVALHIMAVVAQRVPL